MIEIDELPPPPEGRTGWPWTEGSSQRGASGPAISVVVPSFNQGEFIEETIRSVLLQAYPGTELIVMDGGSSDGTVAVLERYDAWIDHWISAPDDGQPAAVNAGMEFATGDFVAFQNSDDFYLADAFWTVARAVEDRADLDIVYGDMIRVDEVGALVDERRYVHAAFWSTLHEGFSMNNQSAFFSRRLWSEIGGITVLDHPGFDYDLILRALKGAGRIRHLRTPLGGFRVHEGSLTSSSTSEPLDPEVIKHPHLGRLTNAPRWVRRLLRYAAIARRSILYILQGDAGYLFKGFASRVGSRRRREARA